MIVSYPMWVSETNSGLLEEQQELLTAEPALQPPRYPFIIHIKMLCMLAVALREKKKVVLSPGNTSLLGARLQ